MNLVKCKDVVWVGLRCGGGFAGARRRRGDRYEKAVFKFSADVDAECVVSCFTNFASGEVERDSV